MARGKEESIGVEFPAIAHLLRSRLQAAAVLSSQMLGISTFGQKYLELQAIPLRAVKGETQVVYVSAIAPKLANPWKTAVTDIATLIAANLFCSDESNDSATNAALQNFTVKVVPPGWIYLQLSDLGTAAWLQRLAQAPPWAGSGGAGEQGSRWVGEQVEHYPRPLFDAQYAHGRCCSLLRLAHREGIIELAQVDPEIRPLFRAIAPNPIPWLDRDQKLRLVHPAESSLIFHLLTLLDHLYSLSPSRYRVDWEKAARTLSQEFLTFYSQCRIWGEVKTATPQLAQARLGLILATQPLLHLLLQDLLGVPAPLEL
ncbi:DALR anticodon-binding domain-containing protein [Microseira wollei]|uniref:Arginyl tRNA synthetase anticodon binding protein n=1 Tax=Microseira wollei NIES-4236 TaxID=2530354 RepID=A0AAV3XFK4_9CYAN|nr:DALR anticodon-binding domain-containing protein [Microseira wollei]GET39142.1 arginyl tRNA synthetase anticodon binding protein [Microseira wollei NIES-4236]